MTTIAVINQKGGVGKTTTTANLGAGLALHGHRVLLIDLDPQANLTSHLEWESTESARTTYDLLCDQAPIEELVVRCAIPNLHLIPSSGDLAAAEVELSTEIGREFILRNHLERATSEGFEYDFILIDCAPSLGLLALNALTAADEALVPIQAEFFALAGMARFMEVQALVQERLNPTLSLAGIVICMWKGQANLSREVRQDVQATFGEVLYQTVIRQNVKLAEAPSRGRTIYEYAPESNGAVDYEAITSEFLVRHGYPEPGDIVCDVTSSDEAMESDEREVLPPAGSLSPDRPPELSPADDLSGDESGAESGDDLPVVEAAAESAPSPERHGVDSAGAEPHVEEPAVPDLAATTDAPVKEPAGDESAAEEFPTVKWTDTVPAQDPVQENSIRTGDEADDEEDPELRSSHEGMAQAGESAFARDILEIVDSPDGADADKSRDVRVAPADQARGGSVNDSSNDPSTSGAHELPGPDSGRPISAGGGTG